MASTNKSRIILGRDGMGTSTTEAEFDSWVAFVRARLPQVDVETAEPRDVQDTRYRADNEDERDDLYRAVQDLWSDWCAEGQDQSDLPDIETIIHAAYEHDHENPEMGFGDLEAALRACWAEMTPEAQARVMMGLTLWGEDDDE